jgi:SAM-dependent methyltransferase
LVSELYRQYYPTYPINKLHSVGFKKGFRGLFESKKWFNFLEGSPDLSIFIKSDESILDIGCSYGASAKIVMERGGLWTGIEIDSRCCEYLRNIELRHFMGSIEEFAEISKEKFDMIMFSQVLEHLYDPLSALRAATKILTDNGRILVSMPNYESRYKRKYGKLWLHWHIPYHVGQWSKKSLYFACEKVGLRIHRFSTVTFFAWWRVQRAFKAAKQGRPNPSYPKGALPRWMHRTGLAILYHLFVDVYLRILDGFGGGDIIIAELKVNKG